jgi:transcriptional regulator with XRE-family HTH domain
MTRKQLAHDSGVSERYLAQIESGHGNISVLVLRELATPIFRHKAVKTAATPKKVTV